jgi:hypothetical protein
MVFISFSSPVNGHSDTTNFIIVDTSGSGHKIATNTEQKVKNGAALGSVSSI